MNIEMKNKAISETSILSALVAILYVVSTYMPFLPMVSFLSAIPFAYIGIKHGEKYFASMLFVTMLIVFILSGMLSAGALLLLGGVSGFTLMTLIKLKKSRSISTAGLVLAFIISYSLIFVLFQYVYSINIIEAFEISALSMRDNMILSVENLNLASGSLEMDNLKQFYTDQFEVIIFTVKTILPYLIVFYSTLSAVLLMAVTYYVFGRAGVELPKSEKYSVFRYEPHILWGTTIIAILSYITINIKFVNSITMAYNLFFIVQLLFAVQGLSIVIFLMEKRKLSKTSKVLFLLLLFFLRPMMILAVLGWVDAIFNFRRIGVNVES
ncbi:MAG: DUF2232 domain-containing protein [Acidaminobacteraceae bacterium]